MIPLRSLPLATLAYAVCCVGCEERADGRKTR
jgi:hypothetical protein